MRIGQLAALSGCSVKAVRFYEAKGLLPTPARTPSGYRLYVERDLRRLQFIQRAKLIGLPLAKIKELVVHVNEEECACATMRPEFEQLIYSEISQLGVKLDQLSLLKEELESLLAKIRRGRRSLPRELCVCAEDGSTKAGRLLAIGRKGGP